MYINHLKIYNDLDASNIGLFLYVFLTKCCITLTNKN